MSSTNRLTPPPPAELGEGRRQSTCLHLYIKSTNQGVSVMHPGSWLTSWQLQCKSGSFIPMTLCQYLYGGDLTSQPFCSLSDCESVSTDWEEERWASNRAELKAFTGSSQTRRCLPCQFEVWLIAQEKCLQKKQLVFQPTKLDFF